MISKPSQHCGDVHDLRNHNQQRILWQPQTNADDEPLLKRSKCILTQRWSSQEVTCA